MLAPKKESLPWSPFWKRVRRIFFTILFAAVVPRYGGRLWPTSRSALNNRGASKVIAAVEPLLDLVRGIFSKTLFATWSTISWLLVLWRMQFTISLEVNLWRAEGLGGIRSVCVKPG